MKTRSKARETLRRHAGLDGSSAPENDFLGMLLIADKNKNALRVEKHVQAILESLNEINTEINGPDRELVEISRDLDALADAAYSISGIIVGGLEYHRRWSTSGFIDQKKLNMLEEAIHKIAYAWDQVLAGDIDDLTEGFDLD
jgi:hypothetical protein